MRLCGQSWRAAADHGTAWSSRVWPIQPMVRPNRRPVRNTVWPNHMIGDSMRKNTVSVTTLPTNRTPPPNALRSFGRVSTSMMVAIFGANHMTSTTTNSAVPASGRMNCAGLSARATATVPTTSRPIQAGEPRNISTAKASW
jgi:hypothetical protein